MNPIQKAMMMTMSPLMNAFNTKIATRSGLVGRFGKFFKFGNREYGSHTSTNVLKYLN